MEDEFKLKEILDKYPELFGIDFDPMKTLMGFGFETGPGWRDIIVSYLPKLSKVVKEEGLDNFIIVQVKEKFGSLSFYTYHSTEKIDEVIHELEEECSKSCEKCGTKENVNFYSNGWLRVRCDTCEKE